MKMKKINYLMTIMFALALLSTSCCKDDPVPDPTGPITLSELEGVWVSAQYEYNGNLYFSCNELENSTDDDVSNGDLMLITVNFSINNTDLSDNCGDGSYDISGMDLDYDRDAGKIVLGNSGLSIYEFNVLSYERGTPETLVLQLTAEYVGGPQIPIGGKYTLQK